MVYVSDLRGVRLTRQRVAVLQAVQRLGIFSSAQMIHGELERGPNPVGLSTVYRSLQLLADRRSIDAVRSPGGEILYRGCSGNHHHMVCRRCGAALEIPDEAVGRLVEQWTQHAGYLDVEHTLTIFGTCPECKARPDAANGNRSQ